MTDKEAEARVRQADIFIRQAAARSIPNEKEPRTWEALDWIEWLALIDNFNDEAAIDATQDYNARMRAAIVIPKRTDVHRMALTQVGTASLPNVETPESHTLPPRSAQEVVEDM